MMHESEVFLRPMTGDDVPEVEKLEKDCFSEAWSEKLLQDMLDSEFDEAWVLVCPDKSVCGYINVRFLAGEGELMRIAIGKEYRGLGYSRKLMEQMMRSAQEKNVCDLTLEVRAGNTPAIRLYKSYGFRKEAVRRDYYHAPTEDAFIMWRRGLPAISS